MGQKWKVTQNIPHRRNDSSFTYHILSVGGGGMLTASVPWSSCTSTVSRRGVFDTSSIFFLMNSVSVAFWKYLDLVILSTKRMILLGLWPPAQLWSTQGGFKGCGYALRLESLCSEAIFNSVKRVFSQKKPQTLTLLLQQNRLRAQMSLPHLTNLRWTTLHHCQPGNKCVACIWTHINKNKGISVMQVIKWSVMDAPIQNTRSASAQALILLGRSSSGHWRKLQTKLEKWEVGRGWEWKSSSTHQEQKYQQITSRIKVKSRTEREEQKTESRRLSEGQTECGAQPTDRRRRETSTWPHTETSSGFSKIACAVCWKCKRLTRLCQLPQSGCSHLPSPDEWGSSWFPGSSGRNRCRRCPGRTTTLQDADMWRWGSGRAVMTFVYLFTYLSHVILHISPKGCVGDW